MLFVLLLSGNRFWELFRRTTRPVRSAVHLSLSPSSYLLQLAQNTALAHFATTSRCFDVFSSSRSRRFRSQYSLSAPSITVVASWLADTHKSPLPRDLSNLNPSPLLPLSSKQAPLTGSCQQKKSRPFFNITCKDGQSLPTKINPQKVHPRGKKIIVDVKTWKRATVVFT